MDIYKKELKHELYVYNIITQVAGVLFGFFYYVFLYRNTLDLRVLLVDLSVLSVMNLVGYLLSTNLVRVKGYMTSIRLSLFSFALAALLAYLNPTRILSFFIFIAALRGLGIGIFSNVMETYLLREFDKKNKGEYFYLNLSIEFLLTTVPPIILGAIITFGGGYKLTFFLAFMLYSIGAILPKQYNKKPKCSLSFNDIKDIARGGNAKEYSLNIILSTGADQLNTLMIAIVPFLLIKTELGVGILASGSALIATVFSYYLKNVGSDKQIRLGYLGGFGRLLGNTFLAIFWSAPILIIRGLSSNFFSVLQDPAYRQAKISTSESILGAKLGQQAMELLSIEAVLSFVGKFFSVVIFLLIISRANVDQASIIRWLLLVYGGWKIIDYYWMQSMRFRFKKYSSTFQLESQKLRV